MTHALKVWPKYYKQIKDGLKDFELRKDDRPFNVGDKLLLQEFDVPKGEYTTAQTERTIKYILRDAEMFGLKEGYCILGLKDPNNFL